MLAQFQKALRDADKRILEKAAERPELKPKNSLCRSTVDRLPR